jgi:hypothetical protein
MRRDTAGKMTKIGKWVEAILPGAERRRRETMRFPIRTPSSSVEDSIAKNIRMAAIGKSSEPISLASGEGIRLAAEAIVALAVALRLELRGKFGPTPLFPPEVLAPAARAGLSMTIDAAKLPDDENSELPIGRRSTGTAAPGTPDHLLAGYAVLLRRRDGSCTVSFSWKGISETLKWLFADSRIRLGSSATQL